MSQHSHDKPLTARPFRRTSLVTTMQTSRVILEMNQRSVGEMYEQMRQTRALIRRTEERIRSAPLPGPCIGE